MAKRTVTVQRQVDGMMKPVEVVIDDTNGPIWGPNDAHRLLNHRLPRVDAPVKATGVAKYTFDIKLPGMLHGRILGSPYSRATVKSIDLTAAKAIPGVRAVVEAEKNLMFEGMPVAAVAADTPEIADDAIHAIKVEYDVQKFVVTAADALKPDAAQVFPNDPAVKGNVRAGEKRGDKPQNDDALSKCDATVEAEYITPTLHHTCLESHGVVIDYRGGTTATVYGSTQDTFSLPRDAARTLGLGQNAVTGIVQFMGGGFGSKFGIGAEGQLACRLSKETNLPVKMMLTRRDEFLASGNGSGAWLKFRAGVMKDGTIAAFESIQYRLGGLGGGSLAGLPYAAYKVQHFYREISAIHTNIDAAVSLRAPGHPPAVFAMESLMDELANKIGMDPLEFRKKNGLNEAHVRQIDRGAKEIGWERRNPVAGGSPGPLKRGFGCGLGVWPGGGRAQCVVTVAVTTDGGVTASVGSQDLGTGTRTYIRAIVAEELGLEMGDVIEQIGNSKFGRANSSGGSTTAASLSPAVKVAAYKTRNEIANRVAPLLGAKPEEVLFDGGKVTGNGKSLTWKQAFAALPAAGLSIQGEWVQGLSSSGVHGVTFAEVEVDVETGHTQVIKMVHVQDVGLPLNRLAVESQINGGMIQGVGMALLEGRIMDTDLGIMVNPSFNDYKIAGALEMPELVALIDDGDPREAVVGVGEPPSIPGAGAIANAIFNACGVRVRTLPITPDKILMGLNRQA